MTHTSTLTTPASMNVKMTTIKKEVLHLLLDPPAEHVDEWAHLQDTWPWCDQHSDQQVARALQWRVLGLFPAHAWAQALSVALPPVWELAAHLEQGWFCPRGHLHVYRWHHTAHTAQLYLDHACLPPSLNAGPEVLHDACSIYNGVSLSPTSFPRNLISFLPFKAPQTYAPTRHAMPATISYFFLLSQCWSGLSVRVPSP